jgi:hypothetical protein
MERLESSAFFRKDKLQHEEGVVALMLHFLHREKGKSVFGKED